MGHYLETDFAVAFVNSDPGNLRPVGLRSSASRASGSAERVLQGVDNSANVLV